MENTKDKNNSQIQEMDSNKGNLKLSPFGHLFRLLASWFGFTGLYAIFAVCPFCGQQGCPVGMASAGTVGAFFALCFQDWKRLFVYIKQKLSKKGYNQPVHRTAKSRRR
jgi:hypothetical protein